MFRPDPADGLRAPRNKSLNLSEQFAGPRFVIMEVRYYDKTPDFANPEHLPDRLPYAVHVVEGIIGNDGVELIAVKRQPIRICPLCHK